MSSSHLPGFGDDPAPGGVAPVVHIHNVPPLPVPVSPAAAKPSWLPLVLTAVVTLLLSLGLPALLHRSSTPAPAPIPGPVTPVPVTPSPVAPKPAPTDPLAVAGAAYIAGIPKGFRATAADVRSKAITNTNAVVNKVGERRKAAGQALIDAMDARFQALAGPDGAIHDAEGVASALESAASGMEVP